MSIRCLAIALLFFLKSPILFSQSCDSVCTCVDNDLNPAGIMLGHEHPKGVWKLLYRYMNMTMDGNLSGTQGIDENTVFNNYLMSPKNMRMDMHMLMAMYGITNKFSVMAMLNYNVISMQMNMMPTTAMNMPNMSANNNTVMNSNVKGISDIQLYAIYELLHKNSHSLFLNGGLNLPTGSIYAKGKSDDVMYPSMRLPYMMQLGSGSLDFLPGLTYLLAYPDFSFGAQITAIARPFNNTLSYHSENKLTINCWATYKWLSWISTSARVEDNYSSAITGSDAQLVMANEPAANPANYGGQLVNAYAGLNVYFNKSFLSNSKLSAEYGIPFYQYVSGIQLGVKSILNVSWIFSF